MDEEDVLEAIVPFVPIVPALSGPDDKLIEEDWDSLDHVGLLSELGPFDRLWD